ncbi:MAG: hypothetical protein KIG14_00015 [Candidatus Sacchiramonaceae bacterium]|nr:hypothetical protein [Candidatus Saccharimonadaceae bacterium]
MDFELSYALAYSVVMLVAVFIVGYLVARAPFVRRFYLPTALVSGIILLILSPQVIGHLSPDLQLSNGFYDLWRTAPKTLINVIFACLFLASPLMPLKKIWKVAGPQVAFSQMMGWGQFFWASLLALVVLVPVFGASPLSGALVEVSFEGGHGTVAGLTNVFRELNYMEGREIANGLSTASLVSSLIIGILLINWGKRKGLLRPGGLIKIARNKVYYRKIVNDLHKKGVTLREHLTFKRIATHILLVAASVGLGILIHSALAQVEELTWGRTGVRVVPFLPLFTFCMIGGMLVGEFVRKLGMKVSRTIVDLISSITLSGLIMTAVGTMNLSFLSSDGAVFGLLYTVGVVWTLFSFLFMGKRMFKEYWFQNAIISFGQSMGMTATGLLFAQMVDPKNRTNAVESFGYKQLLFEPIMGGGVVTALSMPIIALIGLLPFMIISGVMMVFWAIFGMFKFGNLKSKI